jgi:hypothetical protein
MTQAEESRLRHRLEATRKAISFVHGRSRADSNSDEMLALAVVRLGEVLREGAKQISRKTRERYPQIPWRQIAGTRCKDLQTKTAGLVNSVDFDPTIPANSRGNPLSSYSHLRTLEQGRGKTVPALTTVFSSDGLAITTIARAHCHGEAETTATGPGGDRACILR